MTQQEILEYNKRCAEFLGAELYIPKPWYYLPKYREHYYFKNRLEPNRFILKEMKFHSDWNWIMEVVEAIEAIEKIFYIQGVEINGRWCWGETKKEAVVQAINQFLIWYEQNKTI